MIKKVFVKNKLYDIDTGDKGLKTIELPVEELNHGEIYPLPDGLTYDDFDQNTVVHLGAPNSQLGVYISCANGMVMPAGTYAINLDEVTGIKMFGFCIGGTTFGIAIGNNNTYTFIQTNDTGDSEQISQLSERIDSLEVDTYRKDETNLLINTKIAEYMDANYENADEGSY